MKQTFNIQLNNPEYVLPAGKGHSIQSVFSVCFEYPTDNLEIVWDSVTIPFEYRYEVPQLIYPILEMLKGVSASETGEMTEGVGMDTYHFSWKLSWNKNDLTIFAEWERIQGLEPANKLEITVEQFLIECMKLVQLLQTNIKESGVKINGWYYNKKFLYNLERSVNKRLRLLSQTKTD